MAAIATVPVPAAPYVVISSAAAAAGKRSHVVVGGAVGPAPKLARVDTVPSAACLPVPHATLTAARPIVTVRKSEGAKRPQMKYDPSVPMTKEETSAWRREQRRKRNRESAAACRRRQRDRISELEAEASVWKSRFDDAFARLRTLDGESAKELEAQLETLFALAPPKMMMARCSTPPSLSPDVATSITIPVAGGAAAMLQATRHQASHVVSPHDRPKFVPPLVTSSVEEDLHFPVLEDAQLVKADTILPRVENQGNNKGIRHRLTEKTSRSAVKITGAATANNVVAQESPLETIESVCDDLLRVVPDSCLSLTEKKTMPFPEACPSLVPQATEAADAMDASLMGPASAAADAATMAAAANDVMMMNVTTDESLQGASTDESDEDSDLGEFLLDAVQWL